MITAHTSEFQEHTLLNTCSLDKSTDKALAVLRKAYFKNTKDGRPFLRMCFEDINGYIIIGRMFDISTPDTYGKTVNSMVGSLVCVEYTLDYFSGISLAVNSISAVSPEIAAQYTKFFIGKYSLAEAKLMSCLQQLSTRNMQDNLREFRQCYCNLNHLVGVSEESISKGLRGYVLSIIDKVLRCSEDASNEAIVAFLYAVVTWINTRQEIDANSDDSNMMFIASMMSKRVDTAGSGMLVLSNKISEFAALFTGTAHVISSDTYEIYNIWKTLVDTSNIAVLESRLPVDGFCAYHNYTIRRS